MLVWLQTYGEWKQHEGTFEKLRGEFEKRNIVIGAGAFIRERAVIRAGAEIGAGAVIGAGAFIGATIDCVVMGPLGSRNAMLTIYRSKNIIYAATGCFCGTLDKFADAVKKTHGDNDHARRYMAAIAFGRDALNADREGKG